MTCTAGSRRQGAVLAFSLLPFPRLSAPYAQPNSPFRAAPAANRQVRSGDVGAKPRPASAPMREANAGPVRFPFLPRLLRSFLATGETDTPGAECSAKSRGTRRPTGKERQGGDVTRRQIIGEGAQLGGVGFSHAVAKDNRRRGHWENKSKSRAMEHAGKKRLEMELKSVCILGARSSKTFGSLRTYSDQTVT